MPQQNEKIKEFNQLLADTSDINIKRELIVNAKLASSLKHTENASLSLSLAVLKIEHTSLSNKTKRISEQTDKILSIIMLTVGLIALTLGVAVLFFNVFAAVPLILLGVGFSILGGVMLGTDISTDLTNEQALPKIQTELAVIESTLKQSKEILKQAKDTLAEWDIAIQQAEKNILTDEQQKLNQEKSTPSMPEGVSSIGRSKLSFVANKHAETFNEVPTITPPSI